MKQKYLYVKSWATTESKGLGFIDSLLNTVIDLEKSTKDCYVIVGYSQGHTFSQKDLAKIQPTDKATYKILYEAEGMEDIQETKVYAKNLKVVKIILKELFKESTQLDIYREITPKFLTTFTS